MKTFLIAFLFLSLQMLNHAQEKHSTLTVQDCSKPSAGHEAHSLANDLEILKPLMNTNGPDGGYYSEYYFSALQFMYCGAVVRNAGTTPASQVNMKIEIRNDFSHSLYETYFSDTLLLLNPGEVDTLRIPGEMTFGNWIYSSYASHFIFSAKCDFIDEEPSNNTDSVPFPLLSDWMWTNASRSNFLTSSKEVNLIPGFQSGDFFGMTLSIPSGSHWFAYLRAYLADAWPDSTRMTGLIYKNGIPVDSAAFFLPNPPVEGWVFSDMFHYFWDMEPDSLYYLGVRITYNAGATIAIGGDTSSFHNFAAETVVRTGDHWATLDFVPLIQLICDPEGIDESDASGNIRIYPNPASRTVTLDLAGGSMVELYDLSGELLLTDFSQASARKLDIAFLPAGIYILRVYNDKSSAVRKISVIK